MRAESSLATAGRIRHTPRLIGARALAGVGDTSNKAEALIGKGEDWRTKIMTRALIASRRDLLSGGGALLALSMCAGSAFAPRNAQAAHEMSAREQELYAAAKKEGELTWYMSHSDDVTAQALGRNIEALYPGLKANVVRTTAQVAFQ